MLTRQNTFDKAGSLTVKKFWITSGSATGGSFGIGIALIGVAIIYGKIIHDYATTILGTGEDAWPDPRVQDILLGDRSVRLSRSRSTTVPAESSAGSRRKKAMSGDVEQAGGNNTDEAGGIESGMLERLRFAGR